ncbi:MAG: TetM/TetW/TetO/TetS family tetracycline resistance ribosomal protection protein [Clostridiales bacterium]|nr:TetM/TetW/TetO/TetS family tetracycline resistance ribosomal protection protein [Clostridiales bacterium]
MEIINLCILAHVDAGKTTTAEQMLYACGAISQTGSVDQGSAQTDWLPVERQRGISVQSASVIMRYQDVDIQLIDTPGHTDFIGEVERALSAVDCAVLLVSALEGIQSQTEIFWKALRENHIPTIIFVNKIDRAGCDLKKIKATLDSQFGGLLPLNAATNAGGKNCAVSDVLFSDDEVFILSEHDHHIAEAFLAGQALPRNELTRAAVQLTAQCLTFPLIYGAANMSVGIKHLLDAIVTYLPRTKISPEGAPSGLIYKITHDASGKTAHVRMFQGSLRNREQIELPRKDKEVSQKITRIRKVIGQRYEDTGLVRGGEIAALSGLTEAKIGDYIGAAVREKHFSLAEPLYALQVKLDGKSAALPLTELVRAVSALTDEDPLLDCLWNNEERELIIKIMGKVQTEILSYLLKERYDLDVAFGSPTVIYKETPMKPGVGFEAYTMPKPCWAIVELEISPLPRGSGLKFESIVKAEELLPRYQRHIETSLADSLKQGLYNWETTDLQVRLIGGSHHVYHTHPMDFFLATPIAVMKGLQDCGSLLLEPMNLARISAEEVYLTKVIGYVLSMDGEFDSPVIANGKFEMEAVLPVAASIDFPSQLSSLTGGKAVMRTRFHGYRECSPDFIVRAKRRGVNPLDRAKWILAMRSALT